MQEPRAHALPCPALPHRQQVWLHTPVLPLSSEASSSVAASSAGALAAPAPAWPAGRTEPRAGASQSSQLRPDPRAEPGPNHCRRLRTTQVHSLRLHPFHPGSLNCFFSNQKHLLNFTKCVSLGLPRWLSSQESACNAGDPGWIPGSQKSSAKVNGNPLQYPCQENPTDRGAWRATVHRATKSQTGLSDYHFHFLPFNHSQLFHWSRKQNQNTVFKICLLVQ